MMGTKPIPPFANEAEEARWWQAHQDELDEYIAAPTPTQVSRARALMASARPTAPEKLKTRARGDTEQIAIRIPRSDLDQAKAIAERKGIGYQTYLKMLIHEGLQREGA